MQDGYIDTVNYRGFSIPVYFSEELNSYYTIIDAQKVKLDCTADNFEEVIKEIIDDKFDLISEFDSAKLLWFDNGDFRDIKLVYKHRTIFIYLVSDIVKVDLNKIRIDAEKKLNKYIKLAGN